MPTTFVKERRTPTQKHARKCLSQRRNNLSGNPSEDPNQKTQERSNKLEPHKSQQSGNTRRAQTDPQGSEEEFEEGQKTLYRQSGVRSRRSSFSRQYERTI
jgi:hypothetical protein